MPLASVGCTIVLLLNVMLESAAGYDQIESSVGQFGTDTLIADTKALASGFTFTNPNEKGRCGCGESFHV